MGRIPGHENDHWMMVVGEYSNFSNYIFDVIIVSEKGLALSLWDIIKVNPSTGKYK